MKDEDPCTNDNKQTSWNNSDSEVTECNWRTGIPFPAATSHPDQHCFPPTILFSKWPHHDADHLPPSSYLHTSIHFHVILNNYTQDKLYVYDNDNFFDAKGTDTVTQIYNRLMLKWTVWDTVMWQENFDFYITWH